MSASEREAQLRERLRTLEDVPLRDHPAALDDVQAFIESELEALRRTVPGPPTAP